jgi:acyl-CoA synthetase (AMP-forming)/AMP-acid ligase II
VRSLDNLGDLRDPDADSSKTALIDLATPSAPRLWSHGDLDKAAAAVARGLVARGHRRGDRVAILAANCAQFLAAYLGAMRAGLVAVPVNFKLPRETVEYVLRDAGASLVFADAERRAACPPGLPLVELGGIGRDSFEAFLDRGPFEAVQPSENEIAMLLYTSGSTGRPKGVPLSHAGQLWAIRHRLDSMPALDRHRFAVAAPLYHMNALCTAKLVLAANASMVLMPQFRAPAYIEAVARYRCTWLSGVPTMLALIAREPALLSQSDLSCVERIAVGSAPLAQSLIDSIKHLFPQALVSNGYGTTETGPVTFGREHPRGVPCPDIALGYPVTGIRLRLARGDDMDADEGELLLWTPALMQGYHRLPEKTAQVMTEDGYYRTGDVMRRDEHGFYYFVGRADDMLVCGGENVYPGEVERMLERHPDVQQAAVVPVADAVRGQKPVAFVVPAPGASLTEAMVKAFALAHGPAYAHPRRVEIVAELPVAGTGKIDRRRLIERAAALTDEETEPGVQRAPRA